MGKKILAWIETHWIAATVMTMAIVGAIVMTPILTNRWILDSKVKKNLNLLQIQEVSETVMEKEVFEIKEEQGEYKIVPKYNKSVNSWTKSEKQAYVEKVEKIKELQETDKKSQELFKEFLQTDLSQ